MSGDGKVLCQQCNEEFAPDDLKQIYGEDLEICGFICNSCCIKSVEYARRCQIVDCKTRPDSGPTGFRTLPSKFYDLPEGEVKKRIIKQFGIIRTVRACCNMCYVRISKAIVQMKIVYGEVLPRQGKTSPRKAGKYKALSSSASVVETTKAPQAKEDRLAVYTGPKFTRRSGGAPCWNKNKLQVGENVTSTNFGEVIAQDREKSCEEMETAVDDKQSARDKVPSNTFLQANSQSKASNANIAEVKNEGGENSSDITCVKTEMDSKENVACYPQSDNNKNDKNEGISYSSTPISPTSMRFRRIQPKMPKFEEFDLSGDLLDLAEFSPPGSRKSRKKSRGVDEDDETWSPGKSKREKLEGRVGNQKKGVSTNVMSDFVSCTGCRKICSSKETTPVFDEKKGFNVRLCNDCASKRKEENVGCPVQGCSAPKNKITLKPLPSNIFEIDEKMWIKLNEMGVNKDVKECCEMCLNAINNIITTGMQIGEKEVASGDEQVFTMCRTCCKIIPIKDTFPNIEENGRKCGVVCQLCLGKEKNEPAPLRELEIKKEPKIQKKTKGYDPTIKTLGFCTAKGCVHAGEKEPVQLVSGRKILRNYLDENMLRKEFDLADDMDYCCRSCHARIKWFVADIKKKEHGPGADGKTVNSLKNLTPRLKAENEKTKDDRRTSQGKKSQQRQGIGSPGKEDMVIEERVSNPQFDHDSIMVSRSSPLKSHAQIQRTVAQQAREGTECKQESISSSAEGFPPQNSIIFPTPSNFSPKPAIFIPPVNTTANSLPGHPPVLQVGRQQFVLNVISRCEKESQTEDVFGSSEKGVQVNIPLMPKFEGTVPANLPNGKKVKYVDAKEKTKYAVKRAGKELFDQFLQQLDDISGGCAHHLLSDIYRPKEFVMATNYEKILTSIGTLYRNAERGNRQERLRLLSTVALHASNENLKRYFQRISKKGDLVSVNEGEIVQAREYAKQFGPGTHVMPVGQVTWKSAVQNGVQESPDDEEVNEAETERKADKQITETPPSENCPKQHPGTGEDRICEAEDDKVLGRSTENIEPLGGRATPDISMMGKEGEKKFITLEKMNAVEPGAAEKGPGQLVTFKVTVRQAKEKTSNDGSEQTNDTKENENEALENGDEAMQSEVGSKENEAMKCRNETQKNLNVEKKVVEKKKGKFSTGSVNDDGKEEGRIQSKKRKRNSLALDRPRKKSDGPRLGERESESREKRRRTAFSNEGKMMLEKYFEKSIYASKPMVEEISQELGIDKKKVDNWFRNRRSKLKKDEEERAKRDVEMKERKGGKNKDEKDSSLKKEDVETHSMTSSEEEGPKEAAKSDEEICDTKLNAVREEPSTTSIGNKDEEKIIKKNVNEDSLAESTKINHELAETPNLTDIPEGDSVDAKTHVPRGSRQYETPEHSEENVLVMTKLISKSEEPVVPTPVSSPLETLPREASQCKILPRESSPHETLARETLPREMLPRETFPYETLPRESLSRETLASETLPGETLPRETSLRESLSREILPRETFSRETLPRESLSRETLASETLPREMLPRETFSRETLPRESLSRETLASETLPREMLPRETFSRETLPRESLSRETLASETSPRESLSRETLANETLPHETVARETSPRETLPREVPRDLQLARMPDLPAIPNAKDKERFPMLIPVVSETCRSNTFVNKEESTGENRVITDSWPPAEATFALRGMCGYEANGGDVEVREDLAIALNSDPDFMKDLNELMDIAKT